jgi:hypothetical protein
VVDIEVYSNTHAESLEANEYSSQPLEVLRGNTEYYSKLAAYLKALRDDEGCRLTEEANHLLRKAEEMTSNTTVFRVEGGNEFDNIVIRFRVMKEQPLLKGSKITGRLIS